MQGINYVTDENGERIAILIDLKQYGELWEDFYDGLTAKKRENEPRESLESVKKLFVETHEDNERISAMNDAAKDKLFLDDLRKTMKDFS